MTSLQDELELIQNQKAKLDQCIAHLEALKSILPETEIEINKKFYRGEIRRLTDQEINLSNRIKLLLDNDDDNFK